MISTGGLTNLIGHGPELAYLQSWALAVFFYFSIIKMILFAFFIKLICLGVDFLNRNGAEIGYRVIFVKK